MEDYITIRSYDKAWNIDRKIYSILNLRLWVPVSIRPLGYFLGVLMFMLVLARIIPPLQHVNGILLYGGIPYFVSRYLLKYKLDGKAPLRYLASFLRYLVHSNDFFAGYDWHTTHRQKEQLRWFCRQQYEEVADFVFLPD